MIQNIDKLTEFRKFSWKALNVNRTESKITIEFKFFNFIFVNISTVNIFGIIGRICEIKIRVVDIRQNIQKIKFIGIRQEIRRKVVYMDIVTIHDRTIVKIEPRQLFRT